MRIPPFDEFQCELCERKLNVSMCQRLLLEAQCNMPTKIKRTLTYVSNRSMTKFVVNTYNFGSHSSAMNIYAYNMYCALRMQGIFFHKNVECYNVSFL